MEFAVSRASAIRGLARTLRPSSTLIVILCSVLTFATSQSVAQTVQLTAEQQRMLNQLPPIQRQQALQALEQFNRQESGDTQQTSIAEQLSPLSETDKPLPAEFLVIP